MSYHCLSIQSILHMYGANVRNSKCCILLLIQAIQRKHQHILRCSVASVLQKLLFNTDTIAKCNYRMITYHAFHRKASFFSRLLSCHHHHRHCNSLRIHASLIRIVFLSLLHHFLSVAAYWYLPKLT